MKKRKSKAALQFEKQMSEIRTSMLPRVEAFHRKRLKRLVEKHKAK